jgi:acetyl-CoA/propionyl-CoA carboxylase biotin carboxyl carrier protein
VLRSQAFVMGSVGTTFVEKHLHDLIAESAQDAGVALEPPANAREPERTFQVEVNRKLFSVRVAEVKSDVRKQDRRKRERRQTGSAGMIVSPMHGTVIAIKRRAGDTVEEGETVFIVEAMKMENEIVAPRAGTLANVVVDLGATVESGQQLGTIA